MIKKIVDSLKYLKIKDIFAPLFLIVFLPIAKIYKLYTIIMKKELYLICENGKTARDNGYHLFKYIRTKHPDINCKYVIDKKSPHYKKVSSLGKTVQWRSPSHWILYLAAKYNIATQKNANPNEVLFYIIHVFLKLLDNRVFLQHGITKDDAEWLYYKNTHFKYFICGAKKEYDYIGKKFGYPTERLVYTGFPRFDALEDTSSKNTRLLIAPTWRNWLGRETNSLQKQAPFQETNYYKAWQQVLNTDSLIEYLEKNNIKAIFYLHSKMQKYKEFFNSKSRNIEIYGIENDLQEEMKKAKLLITDYSSIYMDFAYMKKPIIYYQFDYKEYRKHQYSQGYFDYKKNGFGPVLTKNDNIARTIETLLKKNTYIEREKAFFEKNDKNNCYRVAKILGIEK